MPIEQVRDKDIPRPRSCCTAVGSQCQLVQYPLRGGAMFYQVADVARQVVADVRPRPIMNCVHGRLALLGDAAHPRIAQGAIMAIEDGGGPRASCGTSTASSTRIATRSLRARDTYD